MELGETLYLKDRRKWRAWLQKNHDKKKEIWLIYFKKASGKPRIPYDDAVEEALCFGWIDSTVKKIDEERYCQRYTPRNMKSIWSDTNIVRVKKMLDTGMLTEHGLKKIPSEVMEAAMSGKMEKKGPVIPKEPDMPPELDAALSLNEKARNNWNAFPPSRRKQIIYWVLDAKKQETMVRRIDKAVELAEQNKRTAM